MYLVREKIGKRISGWKKYCDMIVLNFMKIGVYVYYMGVDLKVVCENPELV